MKKINTIKIFGFQLFNKLSFKAVIVLQLIFWSTTSFAQPSACCTNVNMNNPSYESALTANLRFPDNSSPLNSEYDTPNSWAYADGTNSWQATHIDDASRASEGSKFVYIPFDENFAPDENYCIGNYVFNDVDNTCTDDYVFDGYRYIIYYDFMAFNQNEPAGGIGTTRPKMEYDFPATLDLYESDGTLASEADYTAVAWSDVSSSWTTVAGVTPALNRGGNDFMYFSHYRFGTAGMLIDNAGYTMLTVDDTDATNEVNNESGTQITFDLNPNSNIPAGIANINYTVSAPAGYTVSPTTGEYNTTTSFTLTKNSGTFTPGQIISLDLEDEVNDVCSAILTVEYPVSLPLTLTSFETSAANCRTSVSWEVANVEQFGYFNLEYSTNGVEFESVMFINYDANNPRLKYNEFFDSQVGHKYFRLKMVDLDGSFVYSETISANNDCHEELPVTVFPNPVNAGMSPNVRFESVNGEAIMTISDVTGKPIMNESLQTYEGVNEYRPDLSQLPSGNYFLSIASYGTLKTIRLVVMD